MLSTCLAALPGMVKPIYATYSPELDEADLPEPAATVAVTTGSSISGHDWAVKAESKPMSSVFLLNIRPRRTVLAFWDSPLFEDLQQNLYFVVLLVVKASLLHQKRCSVFLYGISYIWDGGVIPVTNQLVNPPVLILCSHVCQHSSPSSPNSLELFSGNSARSCPWLCHRRWFATACTTGRQPLRTPRGSHGQ